MSESYAARYEAVNQAIFALDEHGEALPPDEMARILVTQLAKAMALVNPFPEPGFVDQVCAITNQRIREAYPPMAPMMVERAKALAGIVAGPFQGLAAIHSGMSVAQREVVLLMLLGRVRPVRIPSGLIAPQ
jgi:hypothetical protein